MGILDTFGTGIGQALNEWFEVGPQSTDGFMELMEGDGDKSNPNNPQLKMKWLGPPPK